MGNDAALERIKPLLVSLQTSPERDTSLAALAADYGCSPFAFHRLFKNATGETPHEHVNRMRLERAAHKLAITDDSVLDVALAVGFKNHETFTRAFRRHYGDSPAAWRRASAITSSNGIKRQGAPEGCAISDVDVVTLKPMDLLAWRRIGPYGAFGPPRFDGASSDWSPLLDEAARQNIRHRPLALVISYDNPFATPPHLQQLDACVPVTDDATEPTGTAIRKIRFDGGRFCAIEHRGPPDTLIQAYLKLVDAIMASKRHRVRDGPPLEILRELSDDPMQRVTEIYIPTANV
ncbi:MAG: helix-turn-helix domain-containing protein [Alphaproteobacteria bacterium]|nr:helix-turn-helix domain-containing protein [Alphaproteobacteria bacterium]